MNIKTRRLKSGHSIDELSALSGVSVDLIRKIERGERNVTAKSAQRLAKAFGLKKWWVLVTPVDAGR